MHSHYHLVTQNKNWNDAQLHCETQYHANLVTIESMEEQLALKAYLDQMHQMHQGNCTVLSSM